MSLIERLGGESKIDKIVDTIYDMIMEIPELENYFSNCRLDEQKLMFKMFVTFVAKKYPKTEAVYKGMKEAHEKLHITNEHFDLMLSLIGKSIRTVCNCSNTINEFLEIAQGYRPLIVFEDTEKSAEDQCDYAISQDKNCPHTQTQNQSEFRGVCSMIGEITPQDIKAWQVSENQRRSETPSTLFDRIGGAKKISAIQAAENHYNVSTSDDSKKPNVNVDKPDQSNQQSRTVADHIKNQPTTIPSIPNKHDSDWNHEKLRLYQTVDDMSVVIDQLGSEKLHLQSEIERLEKLKSPESISPNSKKSSLDSSQIETKKWIERYQDIQKQLSVNETLQKSLEQKNQTLTLNLDKANEIISQQKYQLDTLANQMKKLNEYEEMQVQYLNMQNQINDYQMKLNQMETEKSLFEKSESKLKDQVIKLEGECKSLRKNELELMAAKQQNQLEEVNSKGLLDSKAKEITDLKLLNQKLDEKLGLLQKDNDAQKVEFESLKNKYLNTETALKSAQTTINTVNARNLQLTNENTALIEQLEEVRNRNIQLTNEKAEVYDTFVAVKSQFEKQQLEVKRLQNSINVGQQTNQSMVDIKLEEAPSNTNEPKSIDSDAKDSSNLSIQTDIVSSYARKSKSPARKSPIEPVTPKSITISQLTAKLLQLEQLNAELKQVVDDKKRIVKEKEVELQKYLQYQEQNQLLNEELNKERRLTTLLTGKDL
ncbi:hypothetical protein HDV02_002664 [Globomyces sp. JEL0801]|nr:hypothetical protein HDV02_002664 [Globomyces sp. JEL0801]